MNKLKEKKPTKYFKIMNINTCHILAYISILNYKAMKYITFLIIILDKLIIINYLSDVNKLRKVHSFLETSQNINDTKLSS